MKNFSIHLPAQSGSTSMLTRMRRNHTREAYLELADGIKDAIPGMTFSTDLICGFCGETEQEFEDTLSLIEHMQYEQVKRIHWVVLKKSYFRPSCLLTQCVKRPMPTEILKMTCLLKLNKNVWKG